MHASASSCRGPMARHHGRKLTPKKSRGHRKKKVGYSELYEQAAYLQEAEQKAENDVLDPVPSAADLVTKLLASAKQAAAVGAQLSDPAREFFNLLNEESTGEGPSSSSEDELESDSSGSKDDEAPLSRSDGDSESGNEGYATKLYAGRDAVDDAASDYAASEAEESDGSASPLNESDLAKEQGDDAMNDGDSDAAGASVVDESDADAPTEDSQDGGQHAVPDELRPAAPQEVSDDDLDQRSRELNESEAADDDGMRRDESDERGQPIFSLKSFYMTMGELKESMTASSHDELSEAITQPPGAATPPTPLMEPGHGYAPFFCRPGTFSCLKTRLADEPFEATFQKCVAPAVARRWHESLARQVAEEERQWRQLAAQGSKLAPISCATSSILRYTENDSLSDLDADLFAVSPAAGMLLNALTSYSDLLFTGQSMCTSPASRWFAALHVAQHLYRSKKHEERMLARIKHVQLARSKLSAEVEERKPAVPRGRKREPGARRDAAPGYAELAELDRQLEDFRHAGLTRPRVLVLTPTKQSAREFLERFFALLPGFRRIRKRSEFEEDFGCAPAFKPANHDMIKTYQDRRKPMDYAQVFYGESDDAFRIGVRLKAVHAELYVSFYDADLILASPLGLHMLFSANVKDFDFLSSIEIVIADRADVMLMQHPDHFMEVFAHLNVRPTTFKNDSASQSTVDVRFIKKCFLDGSQAAFRQTILFSLGNRPEYEFLLKEFSKTSIRPLIKLCPTSRGVLATRSAQLLGRCIFYNLPCQTFDQLKKVYEEFLNRNFPPTFMGRKEDERIVLVLPSYLEFLLFRKVISNSGSLAADPRNLSHNFVAVHEYTRKRRLRLKKNAFKSGECRFLITTERFIFYHRSQFRGATQVCFLGAPQYLETFVLLSAFLHKRAQAVVCVVYTKFDYLAIERFVGIHRLAPFFRGEGSATLTMPTPRMLILGD